MGRESRLEVERVASGTRDSEGNVGCNDGVKVAILNKDVKTIQVYILSKNKIIKYN